MQDPFVEFGGSIISNPFQEFGGNTIQNDPFKEFGGQLGAPPITNVPQKQFLANYINSPIYKQRLSNFGISEMPDIQSLLNAHISQVNGAGSLSINKGTSVDTKQYNFPIIKGQNNINIDRGDIQNGYGATIYPDDTLAHELSHVSRKITPKEEDFIASLNKKPDEASAYNEYKKSGVSDSFTNFLNTVYQGTHDARPNEIKADLDALRYAMFKKGIYDTSKRDMTIDDYNKMSNDKDISKSLEFKRLQQRFNPKNLIKLNNTIATNGIQKEFDNYT